jgi:hypothetical protein
MLDIDPEEETKCRPCAVGSLYLSPPNVSGSQQMLLFLEVWELCSFSSILAFLPDWYFGRCFILKYLTLVLDEVLPPGLTKLFSRCCLTLLHLAYGYRSIK